MARRRNLLRQAAQGSDWVSAGQPRLSGRERLSQETARVRAEISARLRLFLDSDSGGVSGMLLSLGETLSDFSRTPFGRALTATAAVTLAYLLIPL